MSLQEGSRGRSDYRREGDVMTEADSGVITLKMEEGPGAKKCRRPLEAEIGKETDSPFRASIRHQPC